jgi:CubicO group peptidase (beta-lactamase class C family)
MDRKLFSLIVLIFLTISSCLKEDEMKNPYYGFTAVSISDGWEISSSGAENMDSVKLDNVFKEVYKDNKNWMMKSLLVFRNGKLVTEYYLRNEGDRIAKDAIWSCTKQINAIITGIAIDKGFISSINDSIGKYLPSYIEKYPEKKGITIRHLLTMRSGITFDNGTQNDILKQHKVENSLDFILDLKLDHQPGTFHNYKDCDPHLLSAIVQHATGIPMDEFGREVFFNPLGFDNYYWHRYSDGVTMGSWGILTTPRELAKVAQCVLDSGKFNGIQVIPISWLKDMLTIHEQNVDGEFSFGYLWWIHPSKGWYFMRGHGGQFAFIVPSKQLVVVITSLPNVDDDCNLPIDYHINLVDKIVASAN